jgi:hypothetical protein
MCFFNTFLNGPQEELRTVLAFVVSNGGGVCPHVVSSADMPTHSPRVCGSEVNAVVRTWCRLQICLRIVLACVVPSDCSLISFPLR